MFLICSITMYESILDRIDWNDVILDAIDF